MPYLSPSLPRQSQLRTPSHIQIQVQGFVTARTSPLPRTHMLSHSHPPHVRRTNHPLLRYYRLKTRWLERKMHICSHLRQDREVALGVEVSRMHRMFRVGLEVCFFFVCRHVPSQIQFVLF